MASNTSQSGHEGMGEFVRPNALVLRNELKNRLESFSVLGKDLQGHPRLRALADLALGDAVDDYEVWLGRVRVGLHGALDFGLAEPILGAHPTPC